MKVKEITIYDAIKIATRFGLSRYRESNDYIYTISSTENHDGERELTTSTGLTGAIVYAESCIDTLNELNSEFQYKIIEHESKSNE